MTSGSKSKRQIAGALAGLLYGLLLSFLSFAAAGAGHGTLVPLIVYSAPLGAAYRSAASSDERGAAIFTMLFAGPLVWALLGWLAALARPWAGLAVALLLLHYASAVALVAATGGLLLADIAGKIPDFVYVWAAAYLLGQLALWWQLGRRLFRSNG